MNNYEHAERLAELTDMGAHKLALMVIHLEQDAEAHQLSEDLQIALRQRSERDAMKRQLDEALEREAALATKLGRYSMCAGHAEQRRAESRAVRKALGFGEDADDVSPQDLLNALAHHDLIKQAETLEKIYSESQGSMIINRGSLIDESRRLRQQAAAL